MGGGCALPRKTRPGANRVTKPPPSYWRSRCACTRERHLSTSKSVSGESPSSTPRVGSRMQALCAHSMLYKTARPCPRCSSHFRLTWNGQCVVCSAQGNLPQQPVSNRARAKSLGKPYYIGRPCRICGASLRLVSNRNCVNCNQERSSAQHQTNKWAAGLQLYGEL